MVKEKMAGFYSANFRSISGRTTYLIKNATLEADFIIG